VASIAVASIATASASAQTPAPFGGGLLPPLSAKGYQPSLGVTVQPGDGQVTVWMDTSLRCGSTTYFFADRVEAPSSGAHFDASGAGRVPRERARVRYSWSMSADVGPQAVTGVVTVTGTERFRGRVRSCKAKPARFFQARLAAAPAGGPAPPRADGLYFGLSDLHVSPGIGGPVVMRVGSGAQRAVARWSFAPRCRNRDWTIGFHDNYSLIGRIAPDGSFARAERFHVRFRDSLIRYRAFFGGTFTSDGARGTLRMRARIFNRHGTRLITRCDTGVHRWTALLGG
jgi:hypothetical protein